MTRRLVAITAVELIGVLQLIALAWLATLAWVFRDHSVFQTYTPQVAAQHADLAVGLSVAFVLNVLALASYARWPDGRGMWLLLGAQVLDIIVYMTLLAFDSSPPDPLILALAIAAALAAALALAVRYSNPLRE